MTRADALRAAAAQLRAAGLGDDAQRDARRLMEAATGASSAALIVGMDQVLAPAEVERFNALIDRRTSREPLSQILGEVGFWTLDLTVSADVLTPRADTETVVAAALEGIRDQAAALNVLDLGTGSGAIVLALLSELPGARAVATDLSAAALNIARLNAARCALEDRITLVETRWADTVEPGFDLIVSNPPYIASRVIDGLEPEVRDYEPRLALDGGADGLDPYPHLVSEARRLLNPGGIAVFEIGYDQGPPVLALAKAGGARAELRQDIAGRDRAVVIQFS